VPRPDDRPSLRRIIARFATGAGSLLGTRLELATIELAQERERLLLRLALIAGGVLALLFGVLGIGAFVVVYFWEAGRLAAILAVAGAFILIGAALLFVAVRSGRRGAALFEATIAEFHKDAALLREVLDRDTREENPK
jgi:uncharacterized membrane protein YqjE